LTSSRFLALDAAMELRDLSHEERLALVALLEVVLESDRTVSDGEVADIDQVVGELGREEYERLVVEVDQRFPTEDELKAFLPSITRQDARELIYGTVLDTAIEDAVDARESAILDWLAALWNVRVEVQGGPDEE
jgi:hypothetical protein